MAADLDAATLAEWRALADAANLHEPVAIALQAVVDFRDGSGRTGNRWDELGEPIRAAYREAVRMLDRGDEPDMDPGLNAFGRRMIEALDPIAKALAFVPAAVAELDRLRAEPHADLGPGATHHGTPGECGCWQRLVSRLRGQLDHDAAIRARGTTGAK